MDASGLQPGNSLKWKVALAASVLLAGCCDKAALERCRVEQAAKLALVEQTVKPSTAPMRLDIRAGATVTVEANVVRVACLSGRGASAEVRVKWKVSTPGVMTVRVTVGEKENANKVWMESGPEGEGVTGPWIQDGALIQLRDPSGDTLLAEVRATSLPCESK